MALNWANVWYFFFIKNLYISLKSFLILAQFCVAMLEERENVLRCCNDCSRNNSRFNIRYLYLYFLFMSSQQIVNLPNAQTGQESTPQLKFGTTTTEDVIRMQLDRAVRAHGIVLICVFDFYSIISYCYCVKVVRWILHC